MVAWKRFPVPEFDRDAFKDMEYQPPAVVAAADAEDLIAKLRAGDDSVCGGYAVMPDDALFGRLAVEGEQRHAIMCLLPDKPVHLLGRSWGWRIQRALVIDSLDPASTDVLHEWRTPRPMNTRFGPEEGVTLETSHVYILSGRIVSDYTRGNRVMIDNDWSPGNGSAGFRVIAACNEGADDFHDSCFQFSWQA